MNINKLSLKNIYIIMNKKEDGNKNTIIWFIKCYNY